MIVAIGKKPAPGATTNSVWKFVLASCPFPLKEVKLPIYLTEKFQYLFFRSYYEIRIAISWKKIYDRWVCVSPNYCNMWITYNINNNIDGILKAVVN